MEGGESGAVRIAVVEDEIIVRRGIVEGILELSDSIKVVGEASNGYDALELVDETSPHIVVTDIRMPVMDGIQLARELHFAYPATSVVIVSCYDEFAYARDALRYGVVDYLLKPVAKAELQKAIAKLIVERRKREAEGLPALNHAAAMSPDALAEIAQEYLKTNYARDVYLTELAGRLGYTPDYIGKVFKKAYGTTPIKYVTGLRIARAKELLLGSPSMDIGAVSEALGFANQFYFSRVFKNATGLYPSAYRDGHPY
jgi:two-component system, response regulator YesN